MALSSRLSSNTTEVEQQSLSLFYKILLYIEDQEKAPIDALDQFGLARQTLGALGRLEGLNYIERVQLNDQTNLVLTDKGDAALASLLSYLPSNQVDWDEKWRIIIFDVPEAMRAVRQMFRLKLSDLGARMLQSSVWITPYASTVERFRDLILEQNFANRVSFFMADHLGPQPIDVARLWELDTLHSEYQLLFRQLQKNYKLLAKSEHPSFEAKCAIVQLAIVAKKDPHLPPSAMPKNWIGYETQNWYDKLRIYCK